MSKKYLFFSALGHALLAAAAIGFPAHAARRPASAKPCSVLIEDELPPFRQEIRSIWVDDNLYLYSEVARIFLGLVDQDPVLKGKIADFKAGKPSPTASELSDLLFAKADQTAGYANSLARRYGNRHNARWFKWHYPVPHVGELATLRVFFTLPVEAGEYELRADLGLSLDEGLAQLRDSAIRIASLRSGVRLPHEGYFSPTYASERDYLARAGSGVPSYCLAGLDARYLTLDLSLPADLGTPVRYEASSAGRGEGSWVFGYASSERSGYSGGSGGGGGDPAAPAPTSTAPAPGPTSTESAPSDPSAVPNVADPTARLLTQPAPNPQAD